MEVVSTSDIILAVFIVTKVSLMQCKFLRLIEQDLPMLGKYSYCLIKLAIFIKVSYGKISLNLMETIFFHYHNIIMCMVSCSMLTGSNPSKNQEYSDLVVLNLPRGMRCEKMLLLNSGFTIRS